MPFEILGLYLIGAIVTYFTVMFFDWETKPLNGYDGPPVPFFCMFWFIGLPILLLGVFGEKFKKMGEKTRELGKQRRKKAEERVRYRIAEQKKQQEFLQESEAEVEEYVSHLKGRK